MFDDNNYTPANLNAGMNGGNFNPSYDPTADDYLGLGGQDINWKDSPSVSSQQRDNSALYDGYGGYTTPYSTASLYMNRRHISMHCFFYTQRDEYDAYWVVGRNDNSQTTTEGNQHQFSQELAGFHTENQNKGIPTMQIYLFGYRDWEQVLKPNDYVALRVWETYPDMPSIMNSGEDQKLYPRDTKGIRHRTLMVGLISQIQVSEDSTTSARVYVVTCQGMQKVLANINLGLPKTAQWNDVNLLYDINGESSPWNEQFPTYSKGGGSSSGSSGSYAKGDAKEVGNANEKAFISWCNQQGLAANQTAGLMGNATIEAAGWSGTGNWWGITRPGTQSGEQADGNGDVENYLNWTVFHKGHEDYDSLSRCPSGFYKYKSETKSMSPYKCADWWCDNILGTTQSDADSVKGTAAEEAYKQIK